MAKQNWEGEFEEIWEQNKRTDSEDVWTYSEAREWIRNLLTSQKEQILEEIENKLQRRIEKELLAEEAMEGYKRSKWHCKLCGLQEAISVIKKFKMSQQLK